MASTAGHSHRSKLCAGAASSSSAAEPMRHTTRHSPFVDEDDGDDMDPGAVTDLLSRLEALDGDAPAPATAPPARAAAGSPFRSGVRNFARLDHDDDDDDDGGDEAPVVHHIPASATPPPRQWDPLGIRSDGTRSAAAPLLPPPPPPPPPPPLAPPSRRARALEGHASQEETLQELQGLAQALVAAGPLAQEERGELHELQRQQATQLENLKLRQRSEVQELLLGQQESHVRMLKRQLHLREQGLRAVPADGDCLVPCCTIL